jgi:hypothetical protein
MRCEAFSSRVPNPFGDDPMSTHADVLNGSRKRANNGHSQRRARAASPDVDRVLREGRALPRKLRRAASEQPELTLALVGGAMFLAGAVLGSRLGRALLGAAIPIGVERLITGELAPRLLAYAREQLGDAARPVSGNTSS